MFEVRDDEDSEIKKYTFDKNICEVIIPKVDNINQLETKLLNFMNLPLAFLKSMKAV